MTTPCKNYFNRRKLCHAECGKYIEYQKGREERLQSRRNQAVFYGRHHRIVR